MFFRMGLVGWIIVLALLVTLVGMIDNMFFQRGRQPSGPTPQSGPAIPSAPVSAVGPPTSTGSAVASGPAAQSGSSSQQLADLANAQVAATRLELLEASKLLTEAAEHAGQANSQIKVWDREIEPLRNNSDGRVVAAQVQLASQIAFLFQEQRPSQQDVTVASERIKSLRDETDRVAAATTPTRLTPETMLEIRERHRRSREASELWTNAVERARAIVREAKRAPVPIVATPAVTAPVVTEPAVTAVASPVASSQPATPPAPGTLPPTSDTPPVSTSPPSPPTAAVAREPAQPKGGTLQETVERISDQAKVEALNQQIAKDAQRKREEEQKQEKMRQEAERLAAAKAKLVAEARSEEVQRVLQPFLVRRNLQPRMAGASVRFRQTFDEQPMSLSALEDTGALAETVHGMSTLARIGSHRELASPRWDFNSSPRTWSADTQQRLKQAQDLLRRLGSTLVVLHSGAICIARWLTSDGPTWFVRELKGTNHAGTRVTGS